MQVNKQKETILQLYVGITAFRDVLITHAASSCVNRLVAWSKGQATFPTKVEKFGIYASKSLKESLYNYETVKQVGEEIQSKIAEQVKAGIYSSLFPYRAYADIREYLHQVLVPVYIRSPFQIRINTTNSKSSEHMAQVLELGTFITYVLEVLAKKPYSTSEQINSAVSTYIACVEELNNIPYFPNINSINFFRKVKAKSKVADKIMDMFSDRISVLSKTDEVISQLILYSIVRYIEYDPQRALTLWFTLFKTVLLDGKTYVVRKMYDTLKDCSRYSLPWKQILTKVQQCIQDCNITDAFTLEVVSTKSLELIPSLAQSSSIEMDELFEFLCWARNLYILSKV